MDHHVMNNHMKFSPKKIAKKIVIEMFSEIFAKKNLHKDS